MRLYGLREIATGVGILIAWDRKPWMWRRVAGAESRRPARVFDYSDRSGLPRPPEQMRGTARRPRSPSFESTGRV